MSLPIYKNFTEEQMKQFGHVRECEVLSTEQHVYSTPFMYDNVGVGDFYEIDPSKGIEFKADTGFITIREDKPVVAVSVIGGGCYSHGYNICEWWEEGETIGNMKNQLVRRQRVDNLNGIHPSIFMQLMMGTFPGLMYRNVGLGVKDPVDCMKKYSNDYYGSMPLGFYENTAYFRIGPPYVHNVKIHCGCLLPEVPGMGEMQQRADYAIRIVETIVIR